MFLCEVTGPKRAVADAADSLSDDESQPYSHCHASKVCHSLFKSLFAFLIVAQIFGHGVLSKNVWH